MTPVTAGGLAVLAPVWLGAVAAMAELQTRTERKYVVGTGVFGRLADELGDGMAALEIDGVRAFRYRSVYFDTPALDAYLGAAHGRRRRFKVRTRTYVDTGVCVLEVKTRSGRGETVKHRLPYDSAGAERLTGEGLDFVRHHAAVPAADRLAPVLTTSYWRATLVDLVAGARITCDTGLVCAAVDGATITLSDHVLVETKSAGGPGAADRFLWRAGCRPVTVSKYCVGMAALHPGLPANRWNRTLRRYFDWAPAALGAAGS